MDAATAYGLISGDSGGVGCDRFVHGDSNNNIEESSNNLNLVSCDPDDHIVHGDLNRFDNLGRVGSAHGDSSSFW